MFFGRTNYPPIEYRPAGWRAWENEEPQPRARVPWVVLLSTLMCACCVPASGLYMYGVLGADPEPTPTVTAVTTEEVVIVPTTTPSSTPTATATATDTPTALPPTATATDTPTEAPTATATLTPTATATATITPTFTPTPQRGIVSRGQALNVRGGPGTVYDIRVTVALGTTFSIREVQSDADGAVWYRVVIDGGRRAGATGWLHSEYVEVIQ